MSFSQFFMFRLDTPPPTPTQLAIRPPLNEKLFPVHRPSGLKRANWNFFSHIFNKRFFFLPFPPVHSSLYKHEIRKEKKQKRPNNWPSFYSPGGQETIIHLRVASEATDHRGGPCSYIDQWLLSARCRGETTTTAVCLQTKDIFHHLYGF